MRRSLSQKAASFIGLPAFTLAWLAPAWFMLGFARLAVLLVPMRYLARFMGSAGDLAARPSDLDDRQEARAVSIGRVIRLAARYAPWSANCFAQALTARTMLGLYGVPYVIFFGLMRDAETREMKAHAWVGAGSARVTGGDGFAQFTVVGTYLSPAQPANAPK